MASSSELVETVVDTATGSGEFRCPNVRLTLPGRSADGPRCVTFLPVHSTCTFPRYLCPFSAAPSPPWSLLPPPSWRRPSLALPLRNYRLSRLSATPPPISPHR